MVPVPPSKPPVQTHLQTTEPSHQAPAAGERPRTPNLRYPPQRRPPQPGLTGLVLLPPLKNGPKPDTRGPDRVGNHRKIMPGIELAAKYQHTLERTSSYPNSNRRPIVSDVSLVR